MASKKSNLPGLLMVLGAVCLLVSLFGGSKSETEDEKRTVSESTRRIEAFVMSHKYVKLNLKSPASAKFPVAGDSHTLKTGAGNYLTRSYVDSQNGFGAVLRTRYFCELEYNEEADGWKLITLAFPDQDKILVDNRPKPEPFRPDDPSLPDIPREPINWQDDPKTVTEQKAPAKPCSDKPNNLQLRKYKFTDKDDELKPLMLYRGYTYNSDLLLATQRNDKVFEVIDKLVPGDSRPQEIWYNVIVYNVTRLDKETKNMTGWISSKDLGYKAIPHLEK